jgi:hypothetical protein
MALAGAWVRTVFTNGVNSVRFLGRTFGAGADAAILGLFGDGGTDAGFLMPSGWPTVGPLETALTATQIQAATIVNINHTTDPMIGATGIVGLTITRGVAPWRITFTCRGTPAAPITPEIDIIFANSSIR